MSSPRNTHTRDDADAHRAQAITWDEEKFVEVRPGVFGASVHTPQLTATLYRYRAGSTWERHQHPEDQITIMLKGEIEFRIGEEAVRLGEGELATIPGGTAHAASVPESGDAVSLNVFTRRETPPRV